ncbi:MAG: alanine racemase, partial [Proteobacteria bacterium]|nr:alanine racemase [Pseudomonadota bacterium]
SAYGSTKIAIEQLLKDCARAGLVDVISLRYFNPVGAHQEMIIHEDPYDMPNNLMPRIIRVALNLDKKLQIFGDDYDTRDGTGERDYIHIDDLVDGYGVVRLDEATNLRKVSNKKILLMQGVYSQEDFLLAKEHNLDLVVHNQHQLKIIIDNKNFNNLWFKVNTGMNRLGFEEDEFLKIYNEYLKDLNFTLMTHLAASNNKEDPSNEKQFKRFEKLCENLHSGVTKSVGNTGCLINFPDKCFDWIRVGIGMYGGYIGDNNLETAMTLKSPIINIREINKGDKVGYDGRAIAEKKMRIASVYLGYADGLPQYIKDGTIVRINNQDACIFGKVSMDLTTIDITDIRECNIGDWCEFFSPKHSI